MTARCAHPGCGTLLISAPGKPLPVDRCWKHSRSKTPDNETVAERWRRITGAR